MPEKACTNCGTPTTPGPRCPDCRIDRGTMRHRNRIRAKVLRRDGLICWICHAAIEPAELHIDHVIPLAEGGTDKADNQRPAHSWCNLEKGRGT